MSLVAVVAAVALAQAPPAQVVQTCGDAPAGSALAGVGHFEQRPARIQGALVSIDVSENACAPEEPRPVKLADGSHTSVTDGLQLRVVPRPTGEVLRRGTVARAALVAPRGLEVASYSARFSGRRTDSGYALRLTAVTAGGRRMIVAGCEADRACDGPGGENAWVAPGSGTGLDGPFARQEFDLPPQTIRLEWSLGCGRPSCDNAATGDAATRGLPATLNVYGSTALFADP